MTPQEARDLGRKAGREGKSAKDNPLLGGPNYLADAWWLGCAESNELSIGDILIIGSVPHTVIDKTKEERTSLVKPQDLEKAVRAICRERARPACDCRAKDCQAPLENLLHETNPMRYQAIAVVDALIRDPNGRVAALERLAEKLMLVTGKVRSGQPQSTKDWMEIGAALAEVEAKK